MATNLPALMQTWKLALKLMSLDFSKSGIMTKVGGQVLSMGYTLYWAGGMLAPMIHPLMLTGAATNVIVNPIIMSGAERHVKVENTLSYEKWLDDMVLVGRLQMLKTGGVMIINLITGTPPVTPILWPWLGLIIPCGGNASEGGSSPTNPLSVKYDISDLNKETQEAILPVLQMMEGELKNSGKDDKKKALTMSELSEALYECCNKLNKGTRE